MSDTEQHDQEPVGQGNGGILVLALLFICLIALVVYVFSFDAVEGRKMAQHRAQVEQVDHLRYLRLMANGSRGLFAKGEHIYKRYCITCHGADGNLSLAQARRLGKDPLRNIPYGPGAHPVSMFETVTRGFQMMPPQTHLPIDERYAAIHYIREAIIKHQNPSQYRLIDAAMLLKFTPAVETQAEHVDKVLGAIDEAAEVDAVTKELTP
ncbi:MAG: cytochrome c [Planctomycetes bacterium]|nr:cytochrome c [Planctomycetota bacterium]